MKTLIGLELHVELKTQRKMFCKCKSAFGDEPNTNVCPVCLGMPGALPVINEFAIEQAIRAGLGLNSEIAKVIKMDRKNYFYPDLVKGYQISQEDTPICAGGYVEIEVDGNKKRIHLERAHIEEDTGKANHMGDITLMDYNRAGLPLIEIVTKPEIESGKEARAFIEELRDILTELGVSDCKMEEGSMRVDCNFNIVDGDFKTAITEVKNIGSTSGVEMAMNYEFNRHKDLLAKGEKGIRETRRWDEEKQETVVMRVKSESNDYRFQFDGDIPILPVEDELVQKIKDNLPELKSERKERLIKTYDLSDYDAGIISNDKNLSEYFESISKEVGDEKLVVNWIMNEFLRRINDLETTIDDLKFEKADFVNLLKLVKENKINNNSAKKVFREMFEDGTSSEEIIKRDNLLQVSDDGAIEKWVADVMEANPDSITDYHNGKDRALGFLVGQVMKASRGKADPVLVNKMILDKLNEMK